MLCPISSQSLAKVRIQSGLVLMKLTIFTQDDSTFSIDSSMFLASECFSVFHAVCRSDIFRYNFFNTCHNTWLPSRHWCCSISAYSDAVIQFNLWAHPEFLQHSNYLFADGSSRHCVTRQKIFEHLILPTVSDIYQQFWLVTDMCTFI